MLIFRAWLALRHFQVLWKEAEWRKTYEVVGRILKAEKDLFKGTESGEQLYRILCEMFKVNEQKMA